jgi:hypothetical protein
MRWMSNSVSRCPGVFSPLPMSGSSKMALPWWRCVDGLLVLSFMAFSCYAEGGETDTDHANSSPPEAARAPVMPVVTPSSAIGVASQIHIFRIVPAVTMRVAKSFYNLVMASIFM